MRLLAWVYMDFQSLAARQVQVFAVVLAWQSAGEYSQGLVLKGECKLIIGLVQLVLGLFASGGRVVNEGVQESQAGFRQPACCLRIGLLLRFIHKELAEFLAGQQLHRRGDLS